MRIVRSSKARIRRQSPCRRTIYESHIPRLQTDAPQRRTVSLVFLGKEAAMGTRTEGNRGTTSFLEYVRASAALAIRDKSVIVVLVLSQLLFLLPMIASYPTGEEAITHERAVENAGIARSELLNYGSEFPEELFELTKQEYESFTAAAEADYPSIDYFAAFGAAREAQDKEWQAGYLTGGLIYKASAELLNGLSKLRDPRVYSSARDLPMLNYLALALGVMPAIILLLPSTLVAHAAIRRLHGHRLLAVAPIGRCERGVGATLVAAALSILGPFAVLLPSALIALVKNGPGDPAYPVVSITDEAVVLDTVLGTLGKDIALALLGAIALALLMGLVNRIRSHAALGICLLTLAIPLFPLYSSESMPWHAVGSMLPMTYLVLDHVVGYPTYTNGLNISLFSGVTFGRGVVVLLAAATLLALAALVVDLVSSTTQTCRLRKEASR